MIKRVICLIVFCLLLNLNRAAESFAESEASQAFGGFITISDVYGTRDSIRGKEIDFNATVLLLNAGVSFRDWESNNNNFKYNRAKVYVGFGVLEYLQFQFSVASDDSTLCVRSYLPLNFEKPHPQFVSNLPDFLFSEGPYHNKIPFRKAIIISPFAEMSLTSKRRVYGIGLGVVFF